jgi:hypothetical protein
MPPWRCGTSAPARAPTRVTTERVGSRACRAQTRRLICADRSNQIPENRSQRPMPPLRRTGHPSDCRRRISPCRATIQSGNWRVVRAGAAGSGSRSGRHGGHRRSLPRRAWTSHLGARRSPVFGTIPPQGNLPPGGRRPGRPSAVRGIPSPRVVSRGASRPALRAAVAPPAPGSLAAG